MKQKSEATKKWLFASNYQNYMYLFETLGAAFIFKGLVSVPILV
jgi:hypothetical protein